MIKINFGDSKGHDIGLMCERKEIQKLTNVSMIALNARFSSVYCEDARVLR